MWDMREMNDTEVNWVDCVDRRDVKSTRGNLSQKEMNLLQQIVASKTGSLSQVEIEYHNRNDTELTVHCRIQSMVVNGYLKEIQATDYSIKHMPVIYYTLTEKSLYILHCVGFWEWIDTIQKQYDELEVPDEIKQIKQWDGRPIPEWVSH